MNKESFNQLENLNNKSFKNKILDFINQIDLKHLPKDVHSKLQILSKIFALGAVIASPSVRAENSEQETLDQFLNSDSTIYQETNVIHEGSGFENKKNVNEEVSYFNKYDKELLYVEPLDILEDEWEYRNKPVAQAKFEFNLKNGMGFEEAYKQLQKDLESPEDLKPIPLLNAQREIGESKTIYDMTLHVQRINSLIESGKLKKPGGFVFVNRKFESDKEIVSALNNSIQYLSGELYKIGNGKYKEQVDGIVFEIERSNLQDSDKIDKLTNVETKLIQLLDTVFEKKID